MLNALFGKIIQASKPAEEAKQISYSKLKSAREEVKESLARHILVENEATASRLISIIKTGDTFGSLASDFSIDTSTKNISGQLDWAASEHFVKDFSVAMISMNKNQLNEEPIRSSFEYHVIKLINVRGASLPSYDELSDQIRKDLITQARNKLISTLRASAKIETSEQQKKSD